MSVPARATLATMLLALVVVAGIVVSQLLLSQGGEIAQPRWPGAVRDNPMPVRPMGFDAGGLPEGPDGRDAPIDWLDITRVHGFPDGQAHWYIELAAQPPRVDGLDPAETVISYGLVFETTGDGRADYVVGISNDAPMWGEYRVWVTDLATGATKEQVGPPYGFPVEFSHPSGAMPGDGEINTRTMVFTFLGTSEPPGLTGHSPFYAWSAVTSAGETVAWDYAPQDAWFAFP